MSGDAFISERVDSDHYWYHGIDISRHVARFGMLIVHARTERRSVRYSGGRLGPVRPRIRPRINLGD